MDHLRKQLHNGGSSKQSRPGVPVSMEGRSLFHSELPSFQAEVQDAASKLNVYYEVLAHLSGAGTHVGERFVETFKGTPYLDLAAQVNSVTREVNLCTLAAVQNSKELSQCLLQELLVVLETSNKNDKSEANLQIMAKCLALLVQAQCQVFSDVSSKLQRFCSKTEIQDFLAQYNSHGATSRQSNSYNQTPATSQYSGFNYGVSNGTGTTSNHKMVLNAGLLSNEWKQQSRKTDKSVSGSGQRKDMCLASEDEVNSVISLLSCTPKTVGVLHPASQPVNQGVYLPTVSISLPPPPLPNKVFSNPPPNRSKPNMDTLQQATPSLGPWPVPLQHRSSYPLMSTPSFARGPENDYVLPNKLLSSQLAVPSVWSANDVNLHHSWPRQKPVRDWSTAQDSKESSSDESSNGDSYLALALGVDLTSDITAVSPRRRHSSSGEETPRAEQPSELCMNRPHSTDNFQLEAKSTNTWPPKQPWARQQIANQMAEMVSADQTLNTPFFPMNWGDENVPKYGPVWMQGYQDAGPCLPYPLASNNNMKLPVTGANLPGIQMCQFTSKDNNFKLQ